MPEPSVSPADTIRRARNRINARGQHDLMGLADLAEELLAVGERDKAEIEAAESLAAMHEGRAQSLAAEVERLTSEREREADELRQSLIFQERQWISALKAIQAARERDWRQIAQLTKALEERAALPCVDESTVVCTEDLADCPEMWCGSCFARAVLAGEEDAE